MSVDIELSSAFGVYTDDKLNFQVEGKTVREAINDLTKRSPRLKSVLLNKVGDLQPTYDFFINGQNVPSKNMAEPLNDGDKLNILYLVHGG
jgi:molybdopterin converting factor small subunit